MKAARENRVFISYAHEDLAKVRQIVKGLKKRKLNVWFDKEDLGPGKWKPTIIKTINQSRYFVICISEAALIKTGDDSNKVGFQDEELNTACEIAMNQPDSEFGIVPVRLEDCDRGDFRLSSYNQYDLFPDLEKGLDRLSVDLGGISLSDAAAKDNRTEDEIMFDSLLGEFIAAYYARDYNRALRFVNATLEIKPDYAEVWYNKGVTLYRLGRREEALKTYNRALEIKPDYAEAWFNIGISLHELDRHEEALKAYYKALEIKPDYAEAWFNIGNALIKLDRHEEALETYNKALEIKPDYADAWANKGSTLHDLDRHEEALEALNKALEIKPDFAEAWVNKGIALEKLDRHEEALEAINKALEIKPDYATAWFNKGVALDKLERHEEALEACSKALKIKPDFAEALGLKNKLLPKI